MGDLDLAAGEYQVWAASIDGAEKQEARAMGTLVIHPQAVITSQGEARSGVRVQAWRLDPLTGHFTVWDGSGYGLDNPVTTSIHGAYSLLLPAGTYYLTYSHEGVGVGRSHLFDLDKAAVVSEPVELSRKRFWQVGPWVIPVPTMAIDEAVMTILPEDGGEAAKLVEYKLPLFGLSRDQQVMYSTAWRGRPTVVAIFSEQVVEKDRLLKTLAELKVATQARVLGIVEQVPPLQTSLLEQRWQSEVPLYADVEGSISLQLGVTSIPTYLLIDGGGVVRVIMPGMVETDRLMELVGEMGRLGG